MNAQLLQVPIHNQHNCPCKCTAQEQDSFAYKMACIYMHKFAGSKLGHLNAGHPYHESLMPYHKIEVAFIELGLAIGTPSPTHSKYQHVQNYQ